MTLEKNGLVFLGARHKFEDRQKFTAQKSVPIKKKYKIQHSIVLKGREQSLM